MSLAISRLFAPAIDFLQRAVDQLSGVALTARVGIDIGKYLAPVRVLGPGFALLIQTLLGGAVLAVMVLAARGAFSLYLRFKQGVQWW